ncbi:sensory box protein [Janthinobacterium sp. Marseille]|uniref:EAL domain-containing protein n=1 Tax=Herminiimonas aquatilis TaxID=345342 RepID=A0ABW2J727_9BURK|nr:EAL domain-containing protein [Janthinobacterium sp. Marseille]ABR91526.1 sensory box protein [Janthinobacterium sp. Marseille]
MKPDFINHAHLAVAYSLVSCSSTGIRSWNKIRHADRARFFARNIHFPLVWFTVILILGVLLWIGVSSELNREKKNIEQNALKDVELLSRSYAEYLTRTIERLDQLTLQVKYDWEKSRGAYRLEEPARNGVFNFKYSAAITIVNRHGAPITSSFPFDNRTSWGDSDAYDYHRSHESNDLHIGMPSEGKISGRTVVRITRRLQDAKGNFNGMIVASVTPDYFFSFANTPVLGQGGLQALVGMDRVVRVAKESESKPSSLAPIFAMTPQQTVPVLLDGRKWFHDKKSRYVASSSLNGYPFFAIVGMSQDSVLARYTVHRDTIRNAAIAITTFLFVFAVIAVVMSLRLAWKSHRLDAVRNTYRIATEFGNEGYYIWSAIQDRNGYLVDFEIIDCNERGATFFGTSKEKLLNTQLSTVEFIRGYLYTLMQQSRIAMEKGFYEDDFEMQAHNQGWIHKRMLRCEDGLAVTFRDVSDRKAHEEELHRLATKDTLTNLPNRYWLMNHLPKALNEANEKQDSLAVLFIDLDDFKNINDTLGHSSGDSLLQVVASRLESVLRPGDSVVRLGGDEFTLLLESLPLQEDISLIANRIMQTFNQPFEIQQKMLTISASMGISRYPFDGRDAETLLKNADIAMYSAKADGKNKVRVYDKKLYEEIELRVDGERQLARAIQEDHFIVYYQPRVEAQTGRMVGMEALVRWAHPERGLIAPDHFIPLAESTGMILPLGRLVMEKVFCQIAAWQFQKLAVVPVSVNVSARQFDEGNVSEFIASCLNKYAVDPRFIEIELTESAMMGNFEQVRGEISSISALGIQIHVDDFGTGYSSLSLLYKFNMDVLKVDRAFTSQICNGKGGEIFFSSIVSMAKVLKMRVVAEGVETIEQLRVLQQLGCDEIQGYLVSKPIPSSDVPRLLDQSILLEQLN